MIFIQRKNSFLFHLLKNILLFEFLSLLYSNQKEIEFPFLFRLNSGNYLMLSDNGIYIFNPTISARLNVKSFDSKKYRRHADSYSTNIAQFLSEDNGYIICLIQNMQYLISKNGIYLTEYPINFIYLN